MPKKIEFKKTKQEAVCKLHNNTYRVMSIWKNDNKKNKIIYYQVQKNRKKISNCNLYETAIRRMMAEANFELQNLYTYKEWLRVTRVPQVSEAYTSFAS